MTTRDSHGLWLALSPLELAESPKIAEMLKPFHKSVTDCYECGVEASTLSCKRERGLDISVTGLFLKRILNDLRATWNLLLLGYTSQAASVAAAAFENALIIDCVAGNIPRAKKMLDNKSGGSPWSTAALCKMYTHQLKEANTKSGEASTNLEEESYCEALYSQYKWLCKVKHPTIPSALHDAFSVSLDGDEYIIMAAPDARKEDLPNKAFILTVTILHIKEAIDSFALSRGLDYESPNVISWKKRFESIIPNLDKAVSPIMKMPLPFDYKGRILKK